MDYKITMLTFSQPIPVGTEFPYDVRPWVAASNRFSMSDAVVSTITITDDDSEFNAGYYDLDPTQQSLKYDVTFGYGDDAQLVPAGTRLSNYIGSYIKDSDGNRFLVMFPHLYEPGLHGEELGSKHSVLIFPVKKWNSWIGEYQTPELDLSKEFRYYTSYSPNGAEDSIDYPPQSVTCFAAGTLIETAEGPRRIEDLAIGDMVMTRDHGLQPVRWIGGTRIDAHQLDLRPQLRPIHISAGALGRGAPTADLVVSPQHRVLVRSRIARRMFGCDEILVAAKHLTRLPGIEVIGDATGMEYWHMLFDRHEIVLSENAWTESLYTGAEALKSVSPAARREILTLFPELARPGFSPAPARRLISGREGRKLAERHRRNAKLLVC